LLDRAGFYLPYLNRIIKTEAIMEYAVSLSWDNDAGVWLAGSADVPGLALESGSLDALIERVKYAIPDLLGIQNTVIRINFQAERLAEVYT
jgi:hypothetical protein